MKTAKVKDLNFDSSCFGGNSAVTVCPDKIPNSSFTYLHDSSPGKAQDCLLFCNIVVHRAKQNDTKTCFITYRHSRNNFSFPFRYDSVSSIDGLTSTISNNLKQANIEIVSSIAIDASQEKYMLIILCLTFFFPPSLASTLFFTF